MYDFKMKPTISFKIPATSHELICNARTRLAAVSHLEWDKVPGSRFIKSSEQCPKVIAFEMSTNTVGIFSTSSCLYQESNNLWIHNRAATGSFLQQISCCPIGPLKDLGLAVWPSIYWKMWRIEKSLKYRRHMLHCSGRSTWFSSRWMASFFQCWLQCYHILLVPVFLVILIVQKSK